ncbi:Ubiquinol-cytochrome C reductase, UQCRX/QCR9 like protein [Trichinella nativa]|uniref:Cytochrome b-c1 complex subunit 9 n=1 Tax=Trichinella nativa TaxID=6335 RepID=A0A1Y3E7P2_9BILA|nr:Ubiquinol-cytochrome C reductase, UQCRX/QCR9 like protein [Trichinella nativa]
MSHVTCRKMSIKRDIANRLITSSTTFIYIFRIHRCPLIMSAQVSQLVAKTKPFMEKIYRYIFQRSATFVLAGVIGAFYMERAVDVICDNIFDKVNEGKQFHDLVKKLESEGKV